jgi:hypothetical protein
MMADRTTKALLLAIAVGLWLNVIAHWVRPVPVSAQSDELSTIQHDLHSIYTGVCINHKIC